MLVLSIVLVCGALYALAFFWLALEAKNAPEGWEDEEGFHLDPVCPACKESYINYGAHMEACYGRPVREDLV